MPLSALLLIAYRSVVNRRVTALLTVFSIALSVTLFLGVEKIRSGAQTGFSNTVSGTDLIVGARSGALNLLLYSVFRIGDATNNVTWESYEDIASRPEIAWAVPISLGDSHRGFRVMGTTAAYFDHYRTGDKQNLQFAAGQRFEDIFDVVLGSDVASELAYGLGEEIVIAHGIGSVSFAKHDNLPFRVVGILERTGTPVDRTVHVKLEGIEAIHLGWSGGTAPIGSRAPSATDVRVADLEPTSVTAVFLGLNSRIAILTLQRDINTYNEEALMAIIPGVALTQLWDVVGVAELALSAIATFVILTGLLGLMTNVLTSLNERRREMAILRSVGAGARHVALLLISESAFLASAGALLGLCLVQILLAAAGPIIVEATGVFVGGLSVTSFDLITVGAVIGFAAVLAGFPAWRAYRQSLSDGLTIRV